MGGVLCRASVLFRHVKTLVVLARRLCVNALSGDGVISLSGTGGLSC